MDIDRPSPSRSLSICKIWDADYPWDIRVEKVSTSLKPGGSALFITGTANNRGAFIATLKPFKGELFQTSVDDELAEQIRQALATGN